MYFLNSLLYSPFITEKAKDKDFMQTMQQFTIHFSSYYETYCIQKQLSIKNKVLVKIFQ